ncbi:MAG TPA: sigma-70 family RNA polymerase sigma factor [Caulobacteraceae bacterium]|nr:sigma-70 family RNA polymerase sigma factor [Caulobacteraceae bacterium]
MEDAIPDDVRSAARAGFERFVDLVTPFRPELHRYCRRLAGDLWDAEDLVQETLLRGFAALGQAQSPIDNPRGYLVRTATNLWIDAQRRRAAESEALAAQTLAAAGSEAPRDAPAVRGAAARLIEQLTPQERAALVLKDVFDLSLAEIAAVLATSPNAVKAALHRGRGRLKDGAPQRPRAAPKAVVDAFVDRLDAGDLPGLLALMLDEAVIEMPPMLVETGREAFERRGSWLWQSVNVHPDLPAEMRPPKWVNRVVEFRGEWIVLGLMPPSHGGTLQGVNRLEAEDGKISRIRSYCFTPETLSEVAETLGLTVGWVPYRFPHLPPAS